MCLTKFIVSRESGLDPVLDKEGEGAGESRLSASMTLLPWYGPIVTTATLPTLCPATAGLHLFKT